MPFRTPIGVIGVGLMGEVYARRLVAAGFTVIGYDVDPAKNERLTSFGAQAGTLADIAQKCEPIVVAARAVAEQLLDADPDLERNAQLREEVEDLLGDAVEFLFKS